MKTTSRRLPPTKKHFVLFTGSALAMRYKTRESSRKTRIFFAFRFGLGFGEYSCQEKITIGHKKLVVYWRFVFAKHCRVDKTAHLIARGQFGLTFEWSFVVPVIGLVGREAAIYFDDRIQIEQADQNGQELNLKILVKYEINEYVDAVVEVEEH